MAEFKYIVEGIYETDKGSGKDYTNFNFEITLSRFKADGAGSHILRRFLPMLIKKQKNKPLLSHIRTFLITDVQKVSDEFPLAGKDISEMNEEEIQELACMYDIFEIPLPNTVSITELRHKAMEAYMKKVLQIPMKTPEEQEKLDFFKRQPDGTLQLDLGEQKLVVQVLNIGKKTDEVKKKSLSDFINANQTNEFADNGILAMTGKFDEGQDDSEKSNDGKFPSLANLTNAIFGKDNQNVE
jgi:hypothetical protein